MTGTPAAEIVVDEVLIRALLAEQFPHYARLPLDFVGEGWDNFIWRLGADLAIRLPRRAVAVPLLVNEQLFLPRLAALLPLPITSPIAVGRPGHTYPWPWSIVPWIAGAPVDRAPLAFDQGPALAGFLRALHQPAPPDVPINPGRGGALVSRRQRFAPCLDELRASSKLITPAVDRAWTQALAAPLGETPVWLHGDLHAQNVLSRDGKLAGIIDWGDLCSGDPAVDLGSVWGVLGDASARTAALAAYDPDDALLARARGWAVLFGATLFHNGRVDDPRHAASGAATLRRLAEDL